ncbi:tetratricopeptide repeat protein [Paludibacter sp.]|uniref:tetratricopeptide repeat protein n=1 Tax=Paludibacter sp. TaxID=1898105 RepID=UPI0013525CFF|nr:tetratricopeptide repeat protein [Paludibacter sp.]MTK53103.1 tetratricopeptide repeat protein [Paludibacter sp.]
MKKIVFILMLVLFALSGFAQSVNFKEGKNAFNNNDLETALKFFSNDIQDNPSRSVTYFYRAWIYYKKSLYAKALEDINVGMKHITRKQKLLKGGLYELKAKVNKELEEPGLAIENYTAAIKCDPKDDDFYAGRAQVCYEACQYEKSESDYLSILKFDENNARAMAGLGRNYLAQKRYEEAGKLLERLKKLHPKYGTAYYFSSKALYKQKKYDEAIDDMFQAYIICDLDEEYFEKFLTYSEKNCGLAMAKINDKIKNEPDNYYWRGRAGTLLMNNGEYRRALKYFTQAIDLKKEPDAYLLTQRGLCYNNLGLLSLASENFKESLKNDSTYTFDYIMLAEIERQKDNYEGANSSFCKALEITPDPSWYFYFCRANLMYKTNNYQLALNDYNKAIEKDTTQSYAYLYRGRLYKYKLNDKEKAIADFELVLKRDTLPSISGNARTFALFELGRIDEAVNYMRKVLDQSTTSSNLYDAACLYSLMNKPDEAIKSLSMAFESGYANFAHIYDDEDLKNIRTQPLFNQLLSVWKTKIDNEFQSLTSVKTKDGITENAVKKNTVVPLHSKGSGTFELACKINNLPLNFIFDTGASDISISQTEVQFMLKNNFLKSSDILGSQQYMDANGNVEVGTKIVLRKVEIGDAVLYNVAASVINNNKAPLLFGQSALSKYGTIVIDNDKKTLSILY